MSTATTDRIEKQTLLHTPRARVWRALTQAREFGSWFGVELSGGTFTPGSRWRGKVTHKGYEHLLFDMTVDEVVPEQRLVWHWPLTSLDPKADPATMPTTRVVFELEEVPEGTRLTVTESGFDSVPLAQRDEAYRGNDDGWAQQLISISRHVSSAP